MPQHDLALGRNARWSFFRPFPVVIAALLIACLTLGIPGAFAQTAPLTITTVFRTGSMSASGMRMPYGVAVDGSRNTYISDYGNNQVLRRSASGDMAVVAGTGEAGYSGDGGAATAANLHSPTGIALDSKGNLYVVDSANFRIRRIDTAGIITTVAGNGTWTSYPGDDGTVATSVGLDPALNSVAVDGNGNLYYSYSTTSVVVKMDTSGILHHVLETGNGLILSAPSGVAVNSQGDLWVSDLNGIYKRAANGTITTVFQTRQTFSTGGMAVSPTGGICYTIESQVDCISTSGTQTVVAGTDLPGLGGDGGPATKAVLYYPKGIGFDPQGNLYIADSGNDRLRKVDTTGSISTVVKGTIAISPLRPKNVAADGSGNLYVSDEQANVVWKVTPDGSVSVFAGTGVQGVGSNEGPATDTTLFAPEGIGADKNGNVYIVESGYAAYRVRRVSSDGIIHAFAGTGEMGFSGDGGSATSARLDLPTGIAVDSAGNVFIADAYNNRIREVTTDGIIHTVAGSGPNVGWSSTVAGGDGGLATKAQLNNPQWLAVDNAGNVYVVESGAYIRKFHPGGMITKFAGSAVASGTGGCNPAPLNGPALAVSFCAVEGLAFSPSGDLYVVDQSRERVARIDGTGNVSTYAGGSYGSSGDNGPAIEAQLNTPFGIATDASGNLFIAETGDARVRRVGAGSVCSVALSSAVSILDSGAASGSFSVNASPDCDYSVASSASWIHIESGASGHSTGTVDYSIDQNTAGSARSGTIVASATGASSASVVAQSGSGCQFSIDPGVPSIASEAGFYMLTVSETPAGCAAWQATSDSPWLQITRAAISVGIPSLDYIVTNNPTPQKRTATITIGSQVATIIQDPSPIVVTSPAPGSTIGSPSQRFSWTIGNADGFRYELSPPGAADIAAGSASVGTVMVSGIPVANEPLVFRLWYSVGGAWQPTPIEVQYQGSSEIAGNAPPEFLYDSAGGNAYTGLSTGTGTFDYVHMPATRGFDIIREGDINGDAKSDVILYNSSNALGYTLLGNGDGTYDAVSLFWGPGFKTVAAGDLNGDGKIDFLIYRSTDGTSYTALSNGDGAFSYKYKLVSPGFTHMALADFSGDGKADVLYYNSKTGAAYLGVSDGAGGFSFSPVSLEAGYNFVETGDINADGKADLLLYSAANGIGKIGTSGRAGFNFTMYSWSPGFTTVKMFDFNGDGKADIALYNKNNTLGYLLAGNGLGTFTTYSLFWGQGFDNVQTLDLNGDGKQDVIIYNSANGASYTGISSGVSTTNPFTYQYAYWGNARLLATDSAQP